MAIRLFRSARGNPDKLGPEPKNIIVCLDGTWNTPGCDADGVDESTNVYRISRALHLPRHRQVALYVKGIGNADENNWLGKQMGGISGAGWLTQLHRAYALLVETYRKGDRIFLFGFSRGAAVARMLALYLQENGVADSFRTGRRAIGPTSKRHKSKFFVELGRNRVPVKIELLGLWDTVGSFGLPRSIGFLKFQRWNLFQNLALAKNVRRAVHLVAIDEARATFHPTLLEPGSRVTELWMPGMHSDVGGGGARRIANIALRNMLERAEECGLRVAARFKKLSCDPLAPLSRAEGGRLHGRELRTIPARAWFHGSTAQRYDGLSSWRPVNLPEGWRTRVMRVPKCEGARG